MVGRPLMHHQNVPQKKAPSKRTLLTSFQRSSNLTLHQIWCGLWGQQLLAGVVPQGTSEKRSKEYVLMVPFFVVRFDGASGACRNGKYFQYSSFCIVVRLPFVLLFWGS